MKIIFLDVDGVLNSDYDLSIRIEKEGKYYSGLEEAIEERPLKLLKELIDKTGAKIVVSSSWRYSWTNIHVKEGGTLFKKLKTELNKVGLEVLDKTPVLSGVDRGDEIRDWLERHPEVESFVILDDDSDMCEFRETNLVKTDYDFGLQEHHIEQAIKILNLDKNNMTEVKE